MGALPLARDGGAVAVGPGRGRCRWPKMGALPFAQADEREFKTLNPDAPGRDLGRKPSPAQGGRLTLAPDGALPWAQEGGVAVGPKTGALPSAQDRDG